jgi:predicted phosphodiesterase
MRIQYISDLHLERLMPRDVAKLVSKIRPVPDVDVLILCGDIGNPYQSSYTDFMSKINHAFAKTFVIAGNHEFYGNEVVSTRQHMKSLFDGNDFPNITFLDNTTETYMDHTFIGSTLWSHISNHQYKINDVFSIKDMTIDLYNQLHQVNRDFISRELNQTHCPAIVLTHHVPLFELTAKKYRTSTLEPYHQWFSANMTDVVLSHQTRIRGWFYGHTHLQSSVVAHGVSFHCNPVGYEYENDQIEYNTYIDI